MEDNFSRKTNNCFQQVLKEKEDICSNIEKILGHLQLQMTLLPKQTESITEKEFVFNNVTNTVALFSSLKHVLLRFLETECSLIELECAKQTTLISKYIKNSNPYVPNVTNSEAYQEKCIDEQRYAMNEEKNETVSTVKTLPHSRENKGNQEYTKKELNAPVTLQPKFSPPVQKSGNLKNIVRNNKSILNSSNQGISKSTAENKIVKLNEKEIVQEENCEASTISFITANISSSVNRESNYNNKEEIGRQWKRKGLTQMPENEILKKGSICAFSHIISPSEFYLQIVDEMHTEFLDCVTDILGKIKIKKSKCKSKNDAFMNIGKYCCAYSCKKKEWFRAEVMDWKLECESHDVEVLAVDFGYIYFTSYRYLKKLPTEATNIPKLAIKCHFALLYPPESTVNNKLSVWPEIATECLRNIAGIDSDDIELDNKLFEVLFAAVQGNSVAVDLVQYGMVCEDTLGDTLIQMKLGVEISDEDLSQNSQEVDFWEGFYEEDEVNNLSELVWGYEPHDGNRVCKFSRSDGSCYKKNNCKLEHIVLRDAFTTDKIRAYSIAKNESLVINCCDTHQVLVTAYLDFSTIFIQIVQNSVKNEKINATMDKDFSDLINSMNNRALRYKEVELSPYIGELVVAFYTNLGLWLRAKVIDVYYKTSTTAFKVFAVDFGFAFNAQLTEIKQIKNEFIELSFQAMKVQLCDYQSCNTYAEEGDILFQDHIIFKNFLCHFKSSRTPISVTITTFKGADIGSILLKHGFVINRTQLLDNIDEQTQPLFDLE